MALAAGADVLVEKPIANTVTGATAMLRTAAECDRRLFVGCNMRFHPAVQLLRAHLPSVGKVAFARAHFGNYLPNMRPGTDYRRNYSAVPEEGGIILDAIHELDYLIWLFGPALSVCCETGQLGDLDAPIQDYAGLLMHHAHGVRSEIHIDYLQQFRRRGCEIVGTAGTMIWQAEGKQPERSSVRRYLAEEGTWHDLFPEQDFQPDAPLRSVMERFVNVLCGGDEPDLLDGAQALHDLQVALTARAAAANPAQSSGIPG
jgi:predicted dehydrogenase